MHKKPWDWEIEASAARVFSFQPAFFRNNKDLLLRFARRDLVASYQQTILGPVWIFLQPLLTTLVYYIVFGKIVRLSTEGLPAVVFYLPGIILWNFFSDCVMETMYTFIKNAHVFNKVYFPRIVVPFSAALVQLVRLLIQLVVFLLVYAYYLWQGYYPVPGVTLLLIPLLLIMQTALALGTGLVMSAVLAKYRDMENIFHFLLRLFMFATPVFYAASIIPPQLRWFYWFNPLTVIIETWRAAFFSWKDIHYNYIALAFVESMLVLLAGIWLFQKRALTVIDTI
ncbi:ABC transporter permease [Deminuibacter soli]|uniref:Transport permease protein n=1 Tax=Deminuibacter soli TaxID=2291815 RepID=A0A3E1NMD5_9BACT|nr:ABC transporter permease [Deminuibacter soli]RFM29090.1 ABC transporter permease [Deminuibacter soli]